MGERENLDRDPAEIRRDIDDTRSSIGAKLELLEESVKDTARETYADVKEKVEDVKKNFSLSHQVQEHPWGFFGASVGVGVVLGGLLSHKLHDHEPASVSSWTPQLSLKSSGNVHTNGHTNGANGHAQARDHKEEGSGFLSNPAIAAGLTGLLSTTFGPELRKAKGVAIGTVLGIVREIARDAVPASMADKAAQVIDQVTRQLGGEPVKSEQKPRQAQPQLAVR